METKNCISCNKNFNIEPQLILCCQKLDIPIPNTCGVCRMSRVSAFVNMHSFYKRECQSCHKNVVTMYPTECDAVIYCNDCWNTDNWDASYYESDFDSEVSFFDQWYRLYTRVPRPALRKVQMVDSEYTNFSVQGNHCYLGYSVLRSEYIRYSENIDDSKNCMDSLCLKSTEWCYENVDSNKNYNCAYVSESKSCIDSKFLFDCSNCQDCFMSSNLRNKRYVFRGEQLSKEDYVKSINNISFDKYSVIEMLKLEFNNLKTNSIHKFADITNSVNSNGNHVLNSRDVSNSFFVTDGDNILESVRVPGVKDLLNCAYIANSESLYACIGCSLGATMCRCSMFCVGSKDSNYSAFCLNCENVFGCVGLRNKKYCILNKQYSKEEYFQLVELIKIQMNEKPFISRKGIPFVYGDFYPPEFSPFSYNETVGRDYFPKTEEEVSLLGFNTINEQNRTYTTTHTSEDLPDSIKDTTDDVTNAVIECLHKGNCNDQCTKAFRVLSEDLLFYRKMNLPLPRLCPNCRFCERFSARPTMALWERRCMCSLTNHGHEGQCTNEFKTSYSPERPEKVYCEKCYQAEVS